MGKKKSTDRPFKLSATGISTFLKSPKAFYWGYIHRLEPGEPSVASYDHDKLSGILWAEYVDRFYHNVDEESNTTQMLHDWDEKTAGWVPEKAKDRLTKALTAWAAQYYQMFSPDDGVRNGSELHLENDRFIAYLDGLSHDKVVHEVKSTSRSPLLMDQLWKVQNSLQVKLYCVLAKATGICIEFAFKDTPYSIYRSEMLPVNEDQLVAWEQQLNTLADKIYSLGTDPNNYPCHPDGCCLVTKNITSMCQYQSLCDMGYNDITKIAYKEKSRR
jgi:PD-(D/E)XK nuclease superfamily protein